MWLSTWSTDLLHFFYHRNGRKDKNIWNIRNIGIDMCSEWAGMEKIKRKISGTGRTGTRSAVVEACPRFLDLFKSESGLTMDSEVSLVPVKGALYIM